MNTVVWSKADRSQVQRHHSRTADPGGSLATVLALVDGLEPQLRVVLYDQRGSFLSPARPATLSFEACLDDLSTLVEELDAAVVHLVGYSFGALLVGAFVGREPHRVGTLSS